MDRKIVRPIPILRAEGALAFAASLAAYHQSGGSWRVFLLFFFAPDVSLAPYAISNSAGWAAYNTAHSYCWPVLLGWLAQERGGGPLWLAALIWCAHISWDRLIGFGLKEGEDFWKTHLGAHAGWRALWLSLAGR